MIEKATELGAAVIQPVITRRTIADHTNVSRLKLIAIEAAEQTERLDVPDVREPIKLEKALELYGGHALIFGDEDSTHEEGGGVPGMAGALKSLADKAPAAILIGPEGGFDSQERERLIGHPRALRVNLGPRILRADTAAISALTLYQAVAGDWRR